MFDIYNDEKGEYLTIEEVNFLAEKYGIKTPQLFGVFSNPTPEQIQEFVGKSNLGDIGEGVVIKNFEFKNKFGDLHYAKIVTQKFKEDNAIMFGGNNRHSETYWETYCVNKYITLARVQKIMNKLQPEINERLDMEHTARIIGTVYHDFIVEEIWSMQKDIPTLNFKRLRGLAGKKTAQIYHDLLGNAPISVADQHRQNKLNSEQDAKADNA